MKFMTVRDLRSKTAHIRKNLAREREIVLTANGKPFALLTPVDPDALEEDVGAVRRARAQSALARIRGKAAACGLHKTSAAEVDALIAAVRRERRPDK